MPTARLFYFFISDDALDDSELLHWCDVGDRIRLYLLRKAVIASTHFLWQMGRHQLSSCTIPRRRPLLARAARGFREALSPHNFIAPSVILFAHRQGTLFTI